MNLKVILDEFSKVAQNPKQQLDNYLGAGKKVILVAPVYTPEEIVHSMDLVPMGAWGADMQLQEAKTYFPTFICSIVQSILELGIKGSYKGVSAIIIPSLCDSLKTLGQNWKYAVPDIPFIPMTYPQNRKPDFGIAFTKAGYQRVIDDLEKVTGETFSDEKLIASLAVYNEHNQVMRELAELLAVHGEVSAVQRSDIFKSAYFMRKEEHTLLVKKLIAALKENEPKKGRIRVLTSGILADNPDFLSYLDVYNMQIVADDVAAESRQYQQDAVDGETGLDRLAKKFADMNNCSVLYDAKKERIATIVSKAKATKAQAVIVILTKFCDPEEFDYPLIKKACEEANILSTLIEVDRQMVNYEQARTILETVQTILSKQSPQ
ncbi:MAG: 2-hydroxyacyl-CoA dehydratase family protein [Fusobacteriaceae bacterium]|jgi:benzoyl-CoA reductase/2-hydroxyglutaryl-CoA dehydratase subunit BcrC/BadD/HgdB|nr:2-hydroxyacyl-CoA dehydratase family protein [Fusobacteriaceae bacterium]